MMRCDGYTDDAKEWSCNQKGFCKRNQKLDGTKTVRSTLIIFEVNIVVSRIDRHVGGNNVQVNIHGSHHKIFILLVNINLGPSLHA